MSIEDAVIRGVENIVVGEEVYMLSGPYIIKGTVVKVDPSVIYVRELPWLCRLGGEIYRFNTEGKGLDKGKDEFGFWELDDMPFAERTALLQRGEVC